MWLRGGWYTDENDVVEVITIFPGYYAGHAQHIHLVVHKGWAQSANGFVHVVCSISVDLGRLLALARSSLTLVSYRRSILP